MSLLYLIALYAGAPQTAGCFCPPPNVAPIPGPPRGVLADPGALAAALAHPHYPVRTAAARAFSAVAAHPDAGAVLTVLDRHEDPEVRDAARRLRFVQVRVGRSAAEKAGEAERQRRRKLVLDRWPLPFVDSMWYDPIERQYCDDANGTRMRGLTDQFPVLCAAESEMVDGLHLPNTPYIHYRRLTARWLLALDSRGVPAEWVDPILAVMRARDSVYLAANPVAPQPLPLADAP